MKFQKLEPFEKNVRDSFPEHLSSVYLIASPKESERKKILFSLEALLSKGADVKRCERIEEALSHLNHTSLLSSRTIALFDGLEELSKAELESLCSYLTSPSPSSVLLLASSGAKNANALYKKGKKELVYLDLLSEKPWDEKARLEKWVLQMVRKEKLSIAPDALRTLFERIPPDRLLLEQELEKLFCFCEREIGRADVEMLCAPLIEPKPYQVAQEIAFGSGAGGYEVGDVSSGLALASLLRSQFEMGLKMASMVQRGVGREEIQASFPRVWPKAFDACMRRVQEKGAPYFKRGLLALFSFELGLKSAAAKPSVLFTRFLANQ